MKNLFIAFIALFITLTVHAQINSGTTENVHVGYHWAKKSNGPISKSIYNNNTPTGWYTQTNGEKIYVIGWDRPDLVQKFRIKFFENEYGPLNRNWMTVARGHHIWFTKNEWSTFTTTTPGIMRSTGTVDACGNGGVVEMIEPFIQTKIIARDVTTRPAPGGDPDLNQNNQIYFEDIPDQQPINQMRLQAGLIKYSRMEDKYYSCNTFLGINGGVAGFNKRLNNIKSDYPEIDWIPELTQDERADCGKVAADRLFHTGLQIGATYFLTKRQKLQTTIENQRTSNQGGYNRPGSPQSIVNTGGYENGSVNSGRSSFATRIPSTKRTTVKTSRRPTQPVYTSSRANATPTITRNSRSHGVYRVATKYRSQLKRSTTYTKRRSTLY